MPLTEPLPYRSPRRSGIPCIVWLLGGVGALGVAFVGLIVAVALFSEETPVTEPSPSSIPSEHSQTPPVSPGNRYGAIAYNSEDGSYGYSYNFSSQAEAEARALAECEQVAGKPCVVLVWFRNACGALARDGRNNAGGGWGETEALAQQAALTSCRQVGGRDCVVVETVCVR